MNNEMIFSQCEMKDQLFSNPAQPKDNLKLKSISL